MNVPRGVEQEKLSQLLRRYTVRLRQHVIGILWSADDQAVPVVLDDAALEREAAGCP